MAHKLRVVDLGDVGWLRSQSLFHGVAHAMRETDPDTLTLCSPTEPYVCVGYHQDVEKEVDVDYCRARGIPVTRREVGGGAVYLDHGQIFWHTIFHRTRVPLLMEEVYRLFLQAPVLAYRALGIDAYHRPVNDLQVGGRKIGGTGAASIGEAVVVASSILYDFNYALMARVLKVPSEKFRDKVYQSLQEYLTTVSRELAPAPPSRERCQEVLIRHFGQALGMEVEYGTLTGRELAAIAEYEARCTTDAWVFQGGGLPKAGVKIAEGIQVLEGAHKAPGGLVRATVRVRDGLVDDLTLSGDFFFYPAPQLRALEQALRGVAWAGEPVQACIEAFYIDRLIQAPGVSPGDMARAILQAREAVPATP